MSVINEAIKKAASERDTGDFRPVLTVQPTGVPVGLFAAATAGLIVLMALVFFVEHGRRQRSETDLAGARTEIARLRDGLADAKRSAAEEADRYRREIKDLNSRLAEAAGQIGSLTAETRSLQEDAIAQDVEIDRLKDASRELQNEKERLLRRVRSFEAAASPNSAAPRTAVSASTPN